MTSLFSYVFDPAKSCVSVFNLDSLMVVGDMKNKKFEVRTPQKLDTPPEVTCLASFFLNLSYYLKYCIVLK
jgi:hypothetical protein